MLKHLFVIVSAPLVIVGATAANGQDAGKQTERFAIAASFLAQGMTGGDVTDNIKIENHESESQPSLEEFFTYAEECKLEEIYTIPQSQNAPIMVQWDCTNILKPGSDVGLLKRQAAFSFARGKISRMVFGKSKSLELSWEK